MPIVSIEIDCNTKPITPKTATAPSTTPLYSSSASTVKFVRAYSAQTNNFEKFSADVNDFFSSIKEETTAISGTITIGREGGGEPEVLPINVNKSVAFGDSLATVLGHITAILKEASDDALKAHAAKGRPAPLAPELSSSRQRNAHSN